MVAAYEHFGVRVHQHAPDPSLPMQVFARDSSFMTPYGAVITNMCNWWRRGENFAAIRTYERLGIPIYDMVTAGLFEGGDFNVIAPDCVLIGYSGERTQEEGARQVADWFAAEGWETRLCAIDPLLRPHRPDGGDAGRQAGCGLPGDHAAGRGRLAEGQGDRGWCPCPFRTP